jgi:ribosomal protein S25
VQSEEREKAGQERTQKKSPQERKYTFIDHIEPFVWTKKVDTILEKVAHCKTVTVTAHW